VSGFDRLLWSKPPRIWSYGVALLSAALALIISRRLFHLGVSPGTLFLCAVMLSAWYGGVGPGLFATVLSTFAFHYYFLPPAYSLPLRPGEIPKLFMYIIANLLIGLLSAAQRNARDDLRRTVQDLQKTNDALLAESRERKQTEEALRQAQADLARANRASSIGELTASLAHEVNQPIAAAVTDANTCLRWLARDQPDLDEARAAASRSINGATRAAEIIKRVRLLFRKDTLQRELVDVNEIIREMMLLLNREATQFGVLVQTELAADLPPIMGDRVQLQQVVMNLMMNSIDAMKDVDGPRELTIQSQRSENGQVLISVSDTGVGLPPQQPDKVFDAFFTTKTHGTGMGLRISRSIVELHGGRLWAADNPPRGAKFCFTLPADGEARHSDESGDRMETADRMRPNT
jgi:C4-dicarboxylate-specific signal transduction histidine kinase